MNKPVEQLSEYSRMPRRQWDRELPACGLVKTDRVDLGLALLSLLARPGVPLTREDIAAWCGCTDSAIWQIEQKALRKLCDRVRFRMPKLYAELRVAFFDRRSPAQRKEAA